MNKEIGSAEWNNELFLKHPTHTLELQVKQNIKEKKNSLYN